MEESKLKMSQTKGTAIYLYSLQYKLLNTFPSARAAAKYFNYADTTIMRNIRSGKVFRREYILSLEELKS